MGVISFVAIPLSGKCRTPGQVRRAFPMSWILPQITEITTSEAVSVSNFSNLRQNPGHRKSTPDLTWSPAFSTERNGHERDHSHRRNQGKKRKARGGSRGQRRLQRRFHQSAWRHGGG